MSLSCSLAEPTATSPVIVDVVVAVVVDDDVSVVVELCFFFQFSSDIFSLVLLHPSVLQSVLGGRNHGAEL